MHRPATSPILPAQHSRGSAPRLPTVSIRLALVLALLTGARETAAQVDSQINKTVWRMYYGASQTQVDSSAWLAADDDHDGFTNGDELAAGTNPFKGTSTIGIDSTTATETQVQINVQTVKGKLYVLQSTSGLGGTWTSFSPSVQGIGEGTPLALTTARTADSRFYRVLVQDTDSDNDHVSDWAERVVGFDPAAIHTKGSPDDDQSALNADLAAQNVVTITATEPVATEPGDALTPASDTATFTVKRGGTLHFGTVTVPLTLSGTAVPGVDFANLPTSVTFAERVGVFNLLVTPMYNAARINNSTVTLRVNAGGGYTLGADTSGTAVIQPAAPAAGTGLTGIYKNTTSTLVGTYAEALFTNPQVTRLDPNLNFSSTAWDGVKVPAAGINATYFVARWTGQVQPQYTERYYIQLRSDDGVKFWLNDQLLIDRWANVTDQTLAVDFVAGVRYNIRIDMNQRAGTGRMELYWYSADQTKQIIPTERLYPAATGTEGPFSITSPISAIGFVGQPFSFQVTSSNSTLTPTTFIRGPLSGPLPPGLSEITAAGLISGTPTTAGDYQVEVQAYPTGNATKKAASVLNIKILPAGNGVTREIWTANVTGDSVRDVPWESAPTTTNTPPVTGNAALSLIEDNGTYNNHVAVRLRGLITPPVTGNYYFWLAANNEAELWISNDKEAANKVRRAWIKAPGTGDKVWAADAAQPNKKSPWLALKAGQSYYYEVRHNRGTNSTTENLSVGWQLDPTGNAADLANGTGRVNDYTLTTYVAPPAIAPTGTLYGTNLAPQGAALSKATGSASLRLNEAKTQAILYLRYSGLTSPKTAYHIHTDAYTTGPVGSQVVHPQGEIIFDIDDIDRFHPEKQTADGGYIWDLAPVGSQSSADMIYALENGFAYLNVHSVNYPAGEIRGNFGKIVGSQVAPKLVAYAGTVTDDHNTDAGAARFLNQATFGAGPADVANVKTSGYASWINTQIGLTPTHLLPEVVAHPAPEYDAPYKSTQFYNAWWKTAVTAPDQLRQRTAFALAEIFVASFVGDSIDSNSKGRMMAVYYDALVDNAFGNYRDIIETVTLSPAMGLYLDMRGNRNGDISVGRTPNENYGREIMQLFSFGLNRLWPNGTLVLSSEGSAVPTYDQSVVNGMARVFTGWNYNQPDQAGGLLPIATGPATDEFNPMKCIPGLHELGEKGLFDNVVLRPAAGYNWPFANTANSEAIKSTTINDAYCLNDLEKALDLIYNHSSTGPYICRQLIQRLVTGAPSPEYVHRVTAVFNDDGSVQHVRGNLAAVIKAVLLDGEARDTTAARASTAFGKQREPLMRITGPARSFPVSTFTGTFTKNAGDLYIKVQTAGAAAHKLIAGNTVALDFSNNYTGTPPVLVANLPASANYTILSTPAPAGDTFYAAPGGEVLATYTQAAGSNLVVINSSFFEAGRQVYLKFTAGGPPDGAYETISVASSKTSCRKVAGPTTAGSALSGSAVYATTAASVKVSQAGADFTMLFRTTQPHYLAAGDQFYLDFGTNTAANTNRVFTVTSVQNARDFTVVTQSPVDVTTTNNTIFPFAIPVFPASGNVGINGSKFDAGSTTNELTQNPQGSPTVFNFYAPEYMYPGTLAANGLTSPEFQLTTDTNIVNLTNAVSNMILEIPSGTQNNNTLGLCSFRSGSNSITLDLSKYMTAPYSVADLTGCKALANSLDDLLTGGAISDTEIDVIAGFAANSANFPTGANQVRDRVRAIVQLILTSSEYATQR